MTPTRKATAYPYERWSTEAQAEGDSARRQLAAAERYASQHPGLTFDRTSTWRDAGVSAFRSGNLKEGAALATFLRAVESKKIPKGSYLLIDRLSRAAPLQALNALQRLLSLGVYVVTLTDGKRYDAASLPSEDVTDLLTALLHARRAHSESVVKSRRVREALKAKRTRAQESKMPLGSICPSWLKLEGGRYVVVKDKAKIVGRIFEWTASVLGNVAVAKRLNRERVPVIRARASAWSSGGVDRLLTSRTVIGEYAPHQTAIDERTGKRTRVPDAESRRSGCRLCGLMRRGNRYGKRQDRGVLAAGTRIAVPPDLSAQDVPVGSSVLITVARSERGEWTARQIEHEPRRNGRGR